MTLKNRNYEKANVPRMEIYINEEFQHVTENKTFHVTSSAHVAAMEIAIRSRSRLYKFSIDI